MTLVWLHAAPEKLTGFDIKAALHAARDTPAAMQDLGDPNQLGIS